MRQNLTTMLSRQLLTHCLIMIGIAAFISACSKGDKAALKPEAPSNLTYSSATAVLLPGKSDTSVTPIVDWHGFKGTFAFNGKVPEGVTIDAATGKISFPSSLAIGTYILPVVAANAATGSDTAAYTLIISGMITTIAGSGNGYEGDGGPALYSKLNMPFDVAVDSRSNIFIADANNSRIRKIGADGTISSFAVVGYPSSLFIDAQDNIYTTGTSGLISKISPAGLIADIAGGTHGDDPGLGDGGPATKADLRLLGGKVSLDAAGNLYVADYGNQRLRTITTDGIIRTINTSIAGPCGTFFDAKSNSLFIAASIGCAIYKLEGDNLVTLAGTAMVTGEDGDGSQAAKATLNRPSNIVVDKAGNLYIADFANNKIRRIGTDGLISTIAGSGKPGFEGDGGPAAAASLNLPYGLAIDNNGDLIIADSYNNRIRKVVLH